MKKKVGKEIENFVVNKALSVVLTAVEALQLRVCLEVLVGCPDRRLLLANFSPSSLFPLSSFLSSLSVCYPRKDFSFSQQAHQA